MFLVDSNVFIEAKNTYYHFDVVPGFWSWIEAQHSSGLLFSVTPVLDELTRGNDELSEWATSLPEGFFLEPDEDTAHSMSQLSHWATTNKQFRDTAVQTFLASADYILVAYADSHGFTVVSQEVAAPESKASIKIPDACKFMGVPHLHIFEWIRREGAKF